MLDSLLGFAASPLAALTSWGEALLRWLLLMNAWTAGLLLGAFLLDRALAKRARASWRLALYAPVALRLLLPLSWRIPLAHTPRVVTLLIPRPEVLLPTARGSLGAPAFTWHAALVLAYAAVAVAIVLVRLRAQLSLRRELRSARLARAATTTAPCAVLEHDVLGPMVVGTIRPRIVVPSLLLSPEQADALGCVLGHESAHVRRGDPWLMAALQVLTVACWPVLPLWLAARRARVLVEMACDEHALDQADADGRRLYGQTLIDIAGWRTVTLSPLALGAGELRFGSGLRARIEALGNVTRWPRMVQAGLVATAVGAFAACSSVGSTEGVPNGPGGTKAAPQGQAWTAPTHELQSEDDLVAYCGPMLEFEKTQYNALTRYRSTTPVGLPAEQVTYCTSPAVRDFVAFGNWVSEAHNSLGQIMRDAAAYYDNKAYPSGRYALCPSGGPVPKVMQAADKNYAPNYRDDWNDGAGWQCLEFGMDQPMWFQYEFVSDGQHVVAKARARRTNYLGEVIEVTDSLRGDIQANHVFNVAPNIEETRIKVQ
jgi:beta-lactamase regulating signal transducer with metallopeptidase domain